MMELKTCKVCLSDLNVETVTPFGKVIKVSKHKCTSSNCRNPQIAKSLKQVWDSYSSKARFVKPFNGGNVFQHDNYRFNIHNSGKIVVIDLTNSNTVIIKDGK